MGMDVYGRNPITEEGGYFRANCWAWRPIMVAIEQSGGLPIIGEEMFNAMQYNDGMGPDGPVQCEKLANTLEQWLEEWEGDKYQPGFEGLEEFGFESDPYVVHREHLEEFINFLRHCGGFQVW